jgi:hypothetical protein
MLLFVIFLLGLGSLLTNIWWLIAPFALLAGAIWGKSGKHGFWSGFIGNSVIWTVPSLIKIVTGSPLLLQKMADLLFLPHWTFLIAIALVIGGVTAGISALAGVMIRVLINDRYFSANNVSNT